VKAQLQICVAMVAAAFGCAQAQHVPALDPIVITASRIAEPQGQATVLVEVISRQQIEESGAANVTELLDQVSGGLLTRQYGRLGIDAAFDLGYLGGATAQRTLVLVDGVRMNDIDGSAIRWGQVPLDAVERIEVRKAGGGVLFGDRALGGVINIITKRKPGTGAVNLTLGSFNSSVLGIQMAKIVGDTTLNLAAQQAQSDGFREEADQATSSLHLGLSGKTHLGTLGLDLRSASENINQPSAISLASFEANPRASDFGLTRSKRRGTNADVTWVLPLGDRSEIRSRWSKEASVTQSFTRYDNDRDTIDVALVFSLGPARGIGGIEFFDATSNSDRLQRASVTQTSAAAYANLEAAIGSSLFNLGARQQRIKNGFSNTIGSAPQGSEENLSAWSVGGLSSVSGFDFRYSFQSSFAFPHADQLFTYDTSNFFLPLDIYPNVKAMRSDEAQLSIEKKWAQVSVRTGVRELKITDEIGQNLDCGPSSPICFNTNLYDTSRTIAFLEGSGRLGASWSWRLVIDQIEAKIDSGANTGKKVPLVPDHAVRAAITHSSNIGRLQLLVNHRSRMFKGDDSPNASAPIPARMVIDLGYTRASDGRTVSVWIRNATNRKYFDFAETWGVAPADGRSLDLRLQQSF
jgi:iron complex outermembrane recepter protein